mgnify:CR=1 FL=1
MTPSCPRAPSPPSCPGSWANTSLFESYQHARSGRYTSAHAPASPGARSRKVSESWTAAEQFRSAGGHAANAPRRGALVETVARGVSRRSCSATGGVGRAASGAACGARILPAVLARLTWHRSNAATAAGTRRRSEARACRARPRSRGRSGTARERIEDDFRRVLPTARIERMDRDTVWPRRAQVIPKRFDAGDGRPRGHPDDASAISTSQRDLRRRPSRRTRRSATSRRRARLQPLTQAGRAGRGDRPGRVIAQAFDPRSPRARRGGGARLRRLRPRDPVPARSGIRRSALVQIVVADTSEGRAWRGPARGRRGPRSGLAASHDRRSRPCPDRAPSRQFRMQTPRARKGRRRPPAVTVAAPSSSLTEKRSRGRSTWTSIP